MTCVDESAILATWCCSFLFSFVYLVTLLLFLLYFYSFQVLLCLPLTSWWFIAFIFGCDCFYLVYCDVRLSSYVLTMMVGGLCRGSVDPV